MTARQVIIAVIVVIIAVSLVSFLAKREQKSQYCDICSAWANYDIREICYEQNGCN